VKPRRPRRNCVARAAEVGDNESVLRDSESDDLGNVMRWVNGERWSSLPKRREPQP
jgi:hypothetical protein